MIPKSKYAITVFTKPTIARNVMTALNVLTPIDLDNEAMFAANKIDCVWPDWFLANELTPGQCPRP